MTDWTARKGDGVCRHCGGTDTGVDAITTGLGRANERNLCFACIAGAASLEAVFHPFFFPISLKDKIKKSIGLVFWVNIGRCPNEESYRLLRAVLRDPLHSDAPVIATRVFRLGRKRLCRLLADDTIILSPAETSLQTITGIKKKRRRD